MDPPRKVYEKKKKGRGNETSSKEVIEPSTKRSKTHDLTQASKILTGSQAEPQPETTPLTPSQPLNDSPTDQAQANPTISLEPTSEIQPEPQLDTTTETIMQIVQQLDGGNEENVERTENKERRGGNDQDSGNEGDDEPYDDFKFSNKRAEKNFEKHWSKRPVIVERGMNLSHFQTEEFKLKQNFEKRGWVKWAQFDGVAVVPIVQEFYANIVETKHEEKDCIVTKVRGVNFKIYPKDVRKFFGLKEEKHPQFPFSEEEALDRDSLAKILTGKPNAEWGHKKKLAKNRLTSKFNSLHFLACSQLNPIMNTSEISYERGLLLYAIDEGLRVELGQIIWESIADMTKVRKGVSGLPFAGFITKFVCKRKVTSELGERVVKPLGCITASSRERSASHKKMKEGTTVEECMEKMYAKWDEVSMKLGEVRDAQDFIKQELQSQGKRIAAIEAKLEILVPSDAVGTSSLPLNDPPTNT